MRVLLIGPNGPVGTAITDRLAERHEFTLLDVEEPVGDGEKVIADVRDYDAIRPHFEGQDVVVNLARLPGMGGPHDRDIAWTEGLGDNLRGITNVCDAAVDAGVDSLVYTSSNHAVGMAEERNAPDVYHNRDVRIRHDEPHRPDSRYGLSKCYGEDLGRLAAEAHDLRFYALRIGNVRPPAYDHPYGLAEAGVDDGRFERGSDAYETQVARMKAVWLSRRDMAHLVECCLRDDSVEWDHFYGVSANERRWLDDLEHARETIGYDPRDNAEEWDGPPAYDR